jgi:hypothetical protein
MNLKYIYCYICGRRGDSVGKDEIRRIKNEDQYTCLSQKFNKQFDSNENYYACRKHIVYAKKYPQTNSEEAPIQSE